MGMADGFYSNPTHPTPPRSEDERLDWLRLIRSRRVGALPGVAAAAGVRDYAVCPVEVVRAEMAEARLAGAVALFFADKQYPRALMDLPDAPPVLWAQGDVSLLQRPMVAVVGARNASSLGIRMARRLADGLGQGGQVVVSGLARGIDSEAHVAAMAHGTVAVQAGGVDVIYPEENAALAEEIRQKGCRVSEQPMGLTPLARHFPQRNRIVAGLSKAVVVVEAAARSGSLITARMALDQGRDVMAVPGHPFDARASGCNMLIRDGAVLVRGPSDVLEALGQPAGRQDADTGEIHLPEPPGPAAPQRPLQEAAELHSRILARLGPSPLAEDQLIRDLAMPPAALAPALLMLELEGQIQRQPGGLLSRC
jgi:DNA processing protein